MMLNRPTWIFAGQIGQFVDREDAAIRSRQQAVVHGQLVRNVLAAARRLDRIDVADHVGDGHVRRRQFLDIAVFGPEPRDRRVVALFGDEIAAAPADGAERIVANFTAGDVRHCRIEQTGQHADNPRLCLTAQSEKNEVVARQNRVDNLRYDGIFITQYAGK